MAMSCPPDVLTPLTWRRQAISFHLLAQAPTIHTLAILLSKASSSTTISCGEAEERAWAVLSRLRPCFHSRAGRRRTWVALLTEAPSEASGSALEWGEGQ